MVALRRELRIIPGLDRALVMIMTLTGETDPWLNYGEIVKTAAAI